MATKATMLYGNTADEHGDAKGASEFISKLLEAVVIIHKVHLMTTGPGSFAAHTALGVYSDLDDLTDGLAEAWMGCSGQGLSFAGVDGKNWPAEVQKIYDYVESNRAMMGSESHIQNEIDSICTALSSALFKLNRLS
jgi:DNA-binding ferritin-like protein